MAKNNEPAAEAVTKENPVVPSNEPEAQAEAAAQDTAKPDKRRKDPSQPVVVPFQLVTAVNRARLAKIGKANDETLSLLLDAFENKGDNTDIQAQHTIARLQDEIKSLNLKLEEANKSVQINAAAIQQREKELKSLQEQFAAKMQEISSKDAEIAALKQQLQNMQAELENTGSESDAEIQQTIKELKDRASKAEDEAKENQKLINGLNESRRELQAKLDKAEAERDQARDALLNVNRDNGNNADYAEGDILHFFPTITAKMLERTADKMTACRKDGVLVTPQMILGDMFNRYTIERWNLWFYKWVLDDNELIEIAQEVDERITSIRMMKAALNIN